MNDDWDLIVAPVWSNGGAGDGGDSGQGFGDGGAFRRGNGTGGTDGSGAGCGSGTPGGDGAMFGRCRHLFPRSPR